MVFLPSSKISSCVGTNRAMMCLLHLVRPCYVALGWALIWGCIQIFLQLCNYSGSIMVPYKYTSLEWDSNLGLQTSTVFEHCLRLKPLGHHSQLKNAILSEHFWLPLHNCRRFLLFFQRSTYLLLILYDHYF